MQRRLNPLRRRRRTHRPSFVAVPAPIELLESRALLSTITVDVPVTKDTTIHSGSEDRNNGAGGQLVTGGDQSGVSRTLIQFDLNSVPIPQYSTILDAVLTLNVNSDGNVGSAVTPHRLLRDWGENTAGDGGPLDPSLEFGATWNFAYIGGAEWDTKGGDFEQSPSASTVIGGPGIYGWSGSSLIADVQDWVDNIEENFGWIILSSDEGGGAMSFSSRESGNQALGPTLQITYEEPLALGREIEGRIFNDADADGIRIDPAVFDMNLTFRNDNNYFNVFGGSEYWLWSETTSNWFYLQNDGALTAWSRRGGELSGEVVSRLDPRVYYHTPKLVAQDSPSTESWVNGVTVEVVDASGDVVDSMTTADIDLNNDGQIDPESESGWYQFTGLATGRYTVRQASNDVWTSTGHWIGPSGESAADLNESLNLRFSSSYFENWGGAGERWIRGDNGWNYITPAGRLYRWNGRQVTASTPLAGTLLAELGREFYRAPDLLFEATSAGTTVSNDTPIGRVDVGVFQAATINGRRWKDSDADGVKDENTTTSSGLSEPWLNGLAFELLDENGYVVATTVSTDTDLNNDGSIDQSAESGWYSFEGVLPGHYTVRAVEQDGWLQTAFVPVDERSTVTSISSLEFRLTQSDWRNWGGLHERWLTDSHSTWHYITPDGSLYRWQQGTGGANGNLNGTLVARLSSSFYVNMKLLVSPTVSTVSASGGGLFSIDFGSHRIIDGVFSDLSDLL